jgi:hypothetical protein
VSGGAAFGRIGGCHGNASNLHCCAAACLSAHLVLLLGSFTILLHRRVAPEVLMGGRQCTQAVDIYSFGVVMWEIMTGERPQRGSLREPRVPQECPQVRSGWKWHAEGAGGGWELVYTACRHFVLTSAAVLLSCLPACRRRQT